MNATAPLVSIIIVNYNGVGFLRSCLERVYAQPYRPIEVIVVDNNSSDGSADIVEGQFPGAKLIRNQENLGFAGGNNLGVERARGEFVILLNNDTEVERSWIPPMLLLLESPSVGVVTSKVITDGVPQEFYEMNGTINYLGYNIMRVFSDLSTVFFAGGASLAFRRQEVAVPFLAEYFLYHEDVYLSWLMRMRGYSVRMAQESVVYHRGSGTTARQPAPLVTFYQERNRLLNCVLMYSGGTLLKLMPYFLADAAAKVLLAILRSGKSIGGILRSYWWVLVHAPRIVRLREEHQACRRIADAGVMEFMSCRVIDSDHVVARAVNACSRFYANLVGLKHCD